MRKSSPRLREAVSETEMGSKDPENSPLDQEEEMLFKLYSGFVMEMETGEKGATCLALSLEI